MENKILIAYASIHGATAEVAEAVAEELRAHGLAVDVHMARSVRSLEGYSAVVLGAPLYMFHLHNDAKRFLARHRAAFTGGMPLAIFAGGPFGKGDAEEWAEIHREMDKELANTPWLKPVAVELIGGKFDPTKLRFPYNLIPALKQVPANDLRDWDAIRAWARSLVGKLAPMNA